MEAADRATLGGRGAAPQGLGISASTRASWYCPYFSRTSRPRARVGGAAATTPPPWADRCSAAGSGEGGGARCTAGLNTAGSCCVAHRRARKPDRRCWQAAGTANRTRLVTLTLQQARHLHRRYLLHTLNTGQRQEAPCGSCTITFERAVTIAAVSSLTMDDGGPGFGYGGGENVVAVWCVSNWNECGMGGRWLEDHRRSGAVLGTLCRRLVPKHHLGKVCSVPPWLHSQVAASVQSRCLCYSHT